MSEFVKIAFGPISMPKDSTLVVFVGADLKAPPGIGARLGEAAARIEAAAKTARFRGKSLTALDILQPSGVEAARLLVIGVAPGKEENRSISSRLAALCSASSARPRRSRSPSRRRRGEWDGGAAADFALGLRLRAYRFDKYKTQEERRDDDENGRPRSPSASADIAAARAAASAAHGGRRRRRDSPAPSSTSRRTCCIPTHSPNARRAGETRRRGGNPRRKSDDKLGMGALLGVGQGSERDSRLVVMRWRGAKTKKVKPVAFVGKGVCFDSAAFRSSPPPAWRT